MSILVRYLRAFHAPRNQPPTSPGLWSPGVPDPTYVPPAASTSSLSGARLSSVFQVTPPPGDTFVLGVDRPALADPLNPTSADNVGWTGDVSGGVFTSTQTVPDGTTRKGCVFLCDVILSGPNSKLDDCIVLGGPPTTSRPAMILANSGGILNRVSVVGWATSMAYYKNGVRVQSGVLQSTRCYYTRVTDCLRFSGGRIISHGDFLGPSCFRDDDADQGSGTPPNWGHADGCQGTAGVGPHEFVGTYFLRVGDCTGVTWSGGSWGSGTAIRGTVPTVHPTSLPSALTPIGMPEVALNAGYTNSVLFPTSPTTSIHGSLYANGLMLSNTSGFNVSVDQCWFEGSDNPSALIQFTTGTTNLISYTNSRFGVGGYWTGSAKFLVSYSSSTPSGQVTRSGNTFGDFPSCVTKGIVGDPITDTSGGSRYNGTMIA